MPIPYSLDLRQRVMAEVDKGVSRAQVAKTFNVHIDTIASWVKLRLETGSITAKTGYQKGHNHKIIDWDEFEKFAKANELCSGEEMAQKWRELKNITMGVDVIYDGLAKIDYTYKKNVSLC